MNVESVDGEKLKISLTYEEISLLFGCYENINYKNADSKATLNILYKKAIELTDFPLDTEKLLIEVKPNDSGCEIYFTKLCNESKEISNHVFRVLMFNNAEDLIRFASVIDTVKSDLYFLDGIYALKIYDLDINTCFALEYCSDITKNEITAEYVAEHGAVICKTNALEMLKTNFKRP